MNKPTFGTYRGWSDNWVYGAMLHGWGKAFILEFHDDVVNDRCVHPKYDQSVLDNIVEVDPKSFAMFTGLYDKEDTPVYGSVPLPDGVISRGGDIVGGNFVRYSSECGRFASQLKRTRKYKSFLNDMFVNLDELISNDLFGCGYTVIGNAYQHPELLPELEVKEK